MHEMLKNRTTDSNPKIRKAPRNNTENMCTLAKDGQVSNSRSHDLLREALRTGRKAAARALELHREIIGMISVHKMFSNTYFVQR